MPKRKEPELDPKEQFKRFKEAVKELEVDVSAQPLDKAFQKVVPQQEAKQVKQSSS